MKAIGELKQYFQEIAAQDKFFGVVLITQGRSKRLILPTVRDKNQCDAS